MRWLAATLFCAGVLCGARARASDLALGWDAPASCPARAELEASLRARVGRPLRFGADAPTELHAQITALDRGYRLSLTTQTESGREERTLEARSCNELARATLLVASLLLSTRPVAAPEQAPSAVDPARSLQLQLALGGVLDVGRLPAAAPGLAARLGLGLGRLRIAAGALYLFERQQPVARQPGAAVALQLTAAQLALCYALLEAPELGVCALGELGSLRAQGHGLPENERASSLWLLAGAGLTLAVPIVGPLDLAGELTLGVPLRRAELSVRQLGSVYRVSALTGQLQVGLRLRLP